MNTTTTGYFAWLYPLFTLFSGEHGILGFSVRYVSDGTLSMELNLSYTEQNETSLNDYWDIYTLRLYQETYTEIDYDSNIIAECDISQWWIDEYPDNSMIRVKAEGSFTENNDTISIAKVRYQGVVNGSLRIRADINPIIRPGDTIETPNYSFIAKDVTFWSGNSTEGMEISA